MHHVCLHIAQATMNMYATFIIYLVCAYDVIAPHEN